MGEGTVVQQPGAGGGYVGSRPNGRWTTTGSMDRKIEHWFVLLADAGGAWGIEPGGGDTETVIFHRLRHLSSPQIKLR